MKKIPKVGVEVFGFNPISKCDKWYFVSEKSNLQSEIFSRGIVFSEERAKELLRIEKFSMKYLKTYVKGTK